MFKKIKKLLFDTYWYFTQNSLLSLTNKKIYNSYPFLFKSNWNNFLEYLTSPKSYKFIIIATIFSLFVCWVSSTFGWFAWINLDIETAKGIVDQRTSNIASIISISLAIAVFLLNNLAKELKKYYDLIFRETLIYPTVYFSLIVLGFLVVLSVLKVHLDPILFCNLVLLFHFLIICVIIAITVLFSKIIKVFDPDYLRNVRLKYALIEATKETILFEEQRIISSQIYSEKLLSIIPPLSITEMALMTLENKHTIFLEHNPNKNIKDIKITKLVRIVKKLKKKDKEGLNGSNLSLNNDLSWGRTIMKIPNNFKSYEKDILKCFKINNYSEHKLSFNSLTKGLFEDVVNAIKSESEDEIEKTLAEFFVIYDIYFDYINSKNKLKSTEISNYPFRGLRFDMVEILKATIKKGNINIIQRVLDFFEKVIIEAYINDAIDIFESYISLSEDIYKWSVNNESIKIIVIKDWTKKLIDFYNFFLNDGIEKEKNQISLFIYSYHNYFAQYLYSILDRLNYDDFQKVYSKYNGLLSYYDNESYISESRYSGNEELLKNLKENYTKTFYSQILFHHVNLALQSWLFYKYQINLIELKENKIRHVQKLN